MKRSMTFVALLVLLSQLLAACTGAVATEVVEPTVPEVAPTEAPTVEPTPSEPVDLEIWLQATVTEAGAPPDDWIAYDIILEDLNINLTYVIMPTGADGEAVLNAAAAANNLPDVVQMVAGNLDVRGQLFRLADLGLLAPVEDMLPMMPERTALHYNDPFLIQLATVDGHLYGFPEPPPIPKREGLVIRQDWLDALGLDTPTNTEELLAVAVAFTTQDPDGNGANDTFGIGGFINGPGLGNRFDFIMGAFGVPDMWDFRDMTAASFNMNVYNPAYFDAVAYFKSLVDADVLDPDWPTLTRDEFRARWKQGRYGIMWEDFAALSNKSNYAPFDELFPDGQWVPLAAPTGPDGEAYYRAETGRGQFIAVSTRAADEGKKEAIARFLEWVATDGYYLLGFGQEGVNFNFDADGNITTEGIAPELAWNSAEMQPFTQMRNQLVFYNSIVEINARYPSYTTEVSGKLMEPLNFLSFFQSQPWVDGRPVQVILQPENAADFTRYYSEGMLQFVLGQVALTEESWAAYLAGLDGLGAQEYIASALQTLIDAGLLQ
ncbi:MAG: hypothetical protein WD751_03505 [Anaerolineales bacterium]